MRRKELEKENREMKLLFGSATRIVFFSPFIYLTCLLLAFKFMRETSLRAPTISAAAVFVWNSHAARLISHAVSV